MLSSLSSIKSYSNNNNNNNSSIGIKGKEIKLGGISKNGTHAITAFSEHSIFQYVPSTTKQPKKNICSLRG
jgi:hypothetical protein